MLKKLDGEIARFRAELDEASRELVPDVSSFIAVQPMPPGTRFTTTADSEIVTVGNIFSCA